MELYDFSVRRPLDQQAAGAIRESLTAVAVRSALVLTALLRRPVIGTCGELAEPAPGSVASSDRMLLRFGDLILAPERSTVTGLAEIFMGAPASKPDRSPTSLEVAILLPRLSDVLYDLPTALGHPAGGTLRQAEPETARQLGVMVLAPFTLEIDPVSYELPLVLPRSMVEGDELATVTHQGGIEQAVAQVPLELEVAFEPLRVSALDIEDLEVGDVLRLDHRQEAPLTGLVGGRPLIRVVPGRPGRHLTVEVTDVLHGEYAS